MQQLSPVQARSTALCQNKGSSTHLDQVCAGSDRGLEPRCAASLHQLPRPRVPNAGPPHLVLGKQDLKELGLPQSNRCSSGRRILLSSAPCGTLVHPHPEESQPASQPHSASLYARAKDMPHIPKGPTTCSIYLERVHIKLHPILARHTTCGRHRHIPLSASSLLPAPDSVC